MWGVSVVVIKRSIIRHHSILFYLILSQSNQLFRPREKNWIKKSNPSPLPSESKKQTLFSRLINIYLNSIHIHILKLQYHRIQNKDWNFRKRKLFVWKLIRPFSGQNIDKWVLIIMVLEICIRMCVKSYNWSTLFSWHAATSWLSLSINIIFIIINITQFQRQYRLNIVFSLLIKYCFSNQTHYNNQGNLWFTK